MSLYINTTVATEHRNQLIREAAAWRRARAAKRPARAQRTRRRAERTPAPVDVAVYCKRAAGFGLRSAS